MENFLDKRTLGIALVVIIAAGFGIYFYQQSVETKAEASKAALYQIQKTLEAEKGALPEAERVVGVALDVDAKYPKSVSALNEMISKKSNSSSVLFEACFKLGTLYLDHAQNEKAVAVLSKINEFAKSDFQKSTGLYLLGTAQERAGQAKEAVTSYEQALARNFEGLKGELMLSVVRASMKSGDTGKAKLFSEKLGKELPGTAAAKSASEMIQ